MTRQKPYHEVTDGRVKATIWHETVNGTVRFNITFTRLFNEAERWWDSTCFREDDMPAVGRIARDVSIWVLENAYRLQDEADANGSGGAA
jgi:hypothetical protein